MPNDKLIAKYGEDTFATGRRIQGDSFDRRVEQRDRLDQHFTKSWLDFAIKGIARRPALDLRTRLLVLIGQYTMARSAGPLEDTIRAALAAKVDPREVLEIILQCAVYGGHTVVEPAIELFDRIAAEQGLSDKLRASQLPLSGTDRERSLEDEKKTWHPDDVADPRFNDLVERHGWLAVGRGLTLRPRHHLNVLSWLDTMDPGFADLWVKFCYGAMYSRGIVDDRTRLLCMIGDCLAAGDETQARGHMRGARRHGASPREVMEVIFQTCVNFGMPPMLKALEVFVEVMAEDKRLDEIGNPPLRVESYGK
jgi:alkylhydroperoxidase/carboxymuconolactone decarboxylase family protein YurZ